MDSKDWVTGKWEKSKHENGDFVVTLEGGFPTICSVGDNEDWAHLIAAAPEMYEMLERISSEKEPWSMEDVKQILSKARGEQ